MTLEQLRIFVAVAEREHVTQAARDLGLTQSATSAAVAALEARHAVTLFDRVGRRIVLTAAGKLFLQEARAVLTRAGAAEHLLDDLAGLRRGALSIAASQTVANYWLPSRLALYRARYPGIAISVTIGNTQTVSDLIHTSSADLGLVEATVDDPHLAIREVAQDELVLVVGAGHAFAKRTLLGWAELCATDWVMREKGSGTRAMFEAALGAAGVQVADLQLSLELPSNEAVCAAVEAGAGAAVVSQMVASRAITAGSLIKLDLALPKRAFFSLRHKERVLTRAAEAFEEVL